MSANGVRQDVRKSGNDQRKTCFPRAAASREVCQQIAPGKLSGNAKDNVVPPAGLLLPVEHCPRPATTKPVKGDRACVTRDFVDWGDDDSGLNPWTTTSRNTRRRKREGIHGSSKNLVLDRTDRSTSFGVPTEGATRQSENSNNSSPGAGGRIHPPATAFATTVLPMKSSPCSLRLLRGPSQGSKRSLQTGKEHTRNTSEPRGNEKTYGTAEATELIRSQDGESSVDIHAHAAASEAGVGAEAGAGAGAGVFLTQTGALMQPGLGMPDVADTCGGVVLRLCPSERSLDPWDTLVAPVRAMCDIEPSLSRAGMEYRSAISAVEEAQEIKTKNQTKVSKYLLPSAFAVVSCFGPWHLVGVYFRGRILPIPRRKQPCVTLSRRKHAT